MNPHEQDLVERSRRGDQPAFEALMAVQSDRLMALAFRILRDYDRAEDAVQSTIVAAWQDLHALRDTGRFDAWLRRVLVHACYAQFRADRMRADVRAISIDASTRDPIAGIVARETVERAFRHLSAEQRVILAFRYYLGFSIEDIATELELPTGTVKSRLHYATSAMRAAIDADDRETKAQEVRA